ncbi:MAG TPA: hypothetical protein VGK67_03835 [Myxococcales bacterium]|jgi:hypothetical protein
MATLERRVFLAVLALTVGGLSGCSCSPCKGPQSACDHACVDLDTDAKNCGACGKACGPAQRCEQGACLDGCATGWTLCKGACSDLAFDANHCGACDTPCLGTQYCANSLCHSRSGSCPYLFLEDQDGAGWRFHTDLSGSPLAYGLDFFKPAYYGPNIYELGGWQASGAVYRMRLRELIFEASYFDEATLLVADVPEGWGIFNEWSSTPQLERLPSLRFQTVKDPRPPKTAISQQGRDVVSELSAADGVPMPVEPSELSRVVVDFGPIQHPEWARLVVTTWGVYDDLRDAQKPPYSGGTTIETPDGAGGWKERVVAGKSASDARTWLIDIAGILTADDTRMRITLAHQPSTLDVLDMVRLDDSEQVPFELTEVKPRVANLLYRGAAQVQAASLKHRLTAQDLTRPPDFPDAFLAGSYTRYGDVRALLEKADDRFVLMAQGDELSLEFDEPAKKAGTTRRVFLRADVFYSLKFHPFGMLTDQLEPLPFHGMPSYPYPAESYPYAGDADYAAYRQEWNTRVIELDGTYP